MLQMLSLLFTLCKVMLTLCQSSTLNCIRVSSLLQHQSQNLKSIECHRVSIIIYKMHAYASNTLRDLPTLMAKHMLVDNYGSLYIWHSILLDFTLVYCKKWWNPCTMAMLMIYIYIYKGPNLKPKSVTTPLIYFGICDCWVSLVRIKFPSIK